MPIFDTSEGSKAPKHTKHEDAPGIRLSPGPFIATVKNNYDPMRAGRLQVYIPELGGDPEAAESWRTVAYASPFFGSTPPPTTINKADTRPKGQNFTTNAHSYGMWMVPPDVGVRVLCVFVNGDPFKGYWIACIPDWPNMHMVPAISGNDKHALPVVEFNDDDDGAEGTIEQFYNRQTASHDLIVRQLNAQGLSQDKDRGLITSSAFRESPSRVFGISTPGRPLKDPSLSPEGEDSPVDTTVPGRMGGHTFVMDDGDQAGANQLMRFRTASGHMLMMNDTAGFIYVTNAAGTAWFEMDSAGNINMYSGGDFNVAAKGMIQFEAGGAVRIKAKGSIDLNSTGAVNLSGTGAVNITSSGDTKINGTKGLHLKGKNTYLTGDDCIQINGGKHCDISAGCLTLNGVKATKAQAAGSAASPSGMPTKEPWSGHKRRPSSGNSMSNPNVIPSPGPAGVYGKAADFSGNNTAANAPSGYIGQTGGSQQPGPTGFRQGTESAVYTPPATGNFTPQVSNNAAGVGQYTQVTARPGGGSIIGAQGVQGYIAYPDQLGQVVGSGQCVALVQANTDVGATGQWKPGGNVFSDPPAPGTAIATFQNGVYTNTPGQSHAAFYLDQGQDSNGKYIIVQDQWKGQPATVRRIYEGSGPESADKFNTITTNKYPSGVQAGTAPVKQNSNTTPATNNGTTLVGPNVASRPDVSGNPANKGFVSADQEAKNREQLRNEEAAGSVGTPPVITGPTDATKAYIKANDAKIAASDQRINDLQQTKEKLLAEKAANERVDVESEGAYAAYKEKQASLDAQIAGVDKVIDLEKGNKEGIQYDSFEASRARSFSDNTSKNEYRDTVAPAQLDDATPRGGEVAFAERDGSNQVLKTGFDETTGQEYSYYESPPTPQDRDVNAAMAEFDSRQNSPGGVYDPGGVSPDAYTTDPPPMPTIEDVSLQQQQRANDSLVNDQLKNVDNPYGDQSSWGQGGTIAQTQADAAASDRGSGGDTTPVTGKNLSPGQGGTGAAGAPTNNAPQSPQGPAC